MPPVIEKGHGRVEQRRGRFVEVRAEELGLPHARCVIEVERRRWRRDRNGEEKESEERVLWVCSRVPADEAGQKDLLEAVRSHWHIENKVHHRRDATMREDRCRIRKPKVARVMSSLRNLIIGLHEYSDKIFRAYRFTSLPDMTETFAQKTPKLLQWLTKAKCFLV